MPTFKILDSLNTSLLDVPAKSDSGIGKYVKASLVPLRALKPLATSLQKPLSQALTNPVAMEFSLPDPIAIGGPGDLALDAGLGVAVGVHQPDELLFPADDLRDAISVPAGTAYVSIGLTPRVHVAADGKQGPLAFGFAAGGSVSLRFFQPFDVAGGDPTLANALTQTLQQATVPGGIDDLATLPIGAFASIEGEGEIQLSGSVEFASVTNPLATPGLPVVGSASVSAGASVTVDASWRASGAFELRVTKMADGRVRLSYYKRAGSEVSIDATASVGVTAKIGDSDAIKKLLAAISSDPQADLVQLVNAGLTDAQIEALQKAVAASVDRSLRIATEMQFSSVRHGEALFAYDIDVASLTPDGRAAVESALKGRLAAINDVSKSADGPVRAVQTGILRRREKRVAWRINLFGVLNVRGVAELLRKGSLSYDPLTGTLNAADEIASKKILVKTRPFEADGQKVRKLAFESMIVTAAYHASRVTSGVALKCAATYFESRQKTSADDIRADYNAIAGLNLADAQERDRRIGQETDFGPSTFLVDCTFDQRAADALFIGPTGARPREFYERIGRKAMLDLIPAGDAERAHRRSAIENDATWDALKEAGPAAAQFELAKKFGTVRAEHIISDYILIRWWSDAMADASTALIAMRQFLNGRTGPELASDPEFAKRRGKLEGELADVVKDSKSQFGDPWGILALDGASSGAATVQTTLVSPKLTVVYNERLLPAAASRDAAAAALPAGQAETPAAEAVERAKPPLTPEQRELLRRHAINLRLGAFSDSGEFQTTEEDVRRIFAELLPQELAARKAAGQKLRLLFYAHGGLTDERGGLEPVLKRLKFWRQNNVYPVSFVWETGLKETVTDILKGLGRTREVAARGFGEDIADAVIEVAGREGGKRVWGQMKRSAEVTVLEGGAGLVVADLVRELWVAHHADMEIHAVGHSAGSIFHASFLPALVGQKTAPAPPLTVKTLHFLAPACTSALFKTKLKDLVGPDKGIRSLTMYTMSKSFEQADTAGPYRKSLLYLVSRAFEPEQPTPILGLEESLRQDVSLIRFFGLAGNQKQADLLFSKSAATAAPRDRTLSTRHGGFDDDTATMSSLMRRVLDVPDGTPIVDFFQEEIGPVRDAANVADAVAESLDRSSAGSGRPQAAAAPSVVSLGAKSRRRAVCVGIDKYGPPYDLAGCVNDATNWAKALRGLDFDVTLLHDQAATRAGILEAFESLTSTARAGDVIVFQYAGHGTQVDDLDGEEDDSLDEAFCPVDFATGRFLIDDDIKAVIARQKPGINLTCFIDCCHSGTITRAMVPGGRPAGMPPDSRARFIPYSKTRSDLHRAFRASGEAGPAAAGTRSAAPAGMKEVCFSACQPHEVAYETQGAGQFTTRAVKVLVSGAALTNGAFMEQVVTAFGAKPAQHPYLDCADEVKRLGLLKPLGVAAPIG